MRRRGSAFGGRLAASVCGAAIAAAACGCAIVGERYGLVRQFEESQVQAIRNGETTRKDILDRLGPPAAVARAGTGATDNVFRRFRAAGDAGPGALAYRYDAADVSWGNLCFSGHGGGGCIPSTPVLKERRLWILFDGATGRVADHFLDETTREEKGVEISPWPGP